MMSTLQSRERGVLVMRISEETIWEWLNGIGSINTFSMNHTIWCTVYCFGNTCPIQYEPCRARDTTLYTDLCSLLQYVEFVDLEEGSPVAVVLHDELKVTGSDQKCNVFLGHVNVVPLTSWEDMDGKVLAIFKVRRGNGYWREEGEGESEERKE